MAGASHGLRRRLSLAPAQPGCYLFRAATGEALYVGKALSLRTRVRSYFQAKAAHPPRIRLMLEEAEELEFIVTGSEVEALILENNLIKKEKPRFNILLRDDKNFPYLKLTMADAYPRLVLVRRAREDSSQYFGPYLPASHARRTLRMAARYFKVAPCYEKLDGGRGRPCLYYHLDQCLGPCTSGLTTQQEYGDAVEHLRLFLKGKNRALLERLRVLMQEASQRQEFERAGHYRDLIRDVEKHSRKQNFARVGLEDQDYFHYYREGERAMVQVFLMREGQVEARREFSFDEIRGEEEGPFLALAVQQYYASAAHVPREVHVPLPLADTKLLEKWLSGLRGESVRIRVPRRGVKAQFMATVHRNAQLAFRSRFQAANSQGVEALARLRDALDLDEAPVRIEAFDISHLQGTAVVASMVVWEGGRAQRSAYRHFKVKTVEGQDDYASMAEVVGRRYRRLVQGQRRMPDLILIDGGKGQLSAAHRALQESGAPPVPMAALAKREEEIFLPGRSESIRLQRSSPALQLLQQIRDEAHRFAVTYHRKLRSRTLLVSELESVPGIGRVRAGKLLKGLGSLKRVRIADEDELARLVPRREARALRKYFHPVGQG